MHTSPVDQPGSGDAGGMNVYVLHLARSLARQGWAVDMATLDRTADHASGVTVTDLSPGLRLLSVALPDAAAAPKEHLPRFTASFGRALARFYDAHDAPLVVHAHYWLSGEAAREVCEVHRVPLLLTLHTSAAAKNLRAGPGENPEPVSREGAERALVNGSCTLVVNTPAEAEHMISLYGAPEDRIRVIPPGVDPAIFHPPVARNPDAATSRSATTPSADSNAGKLLAPSSAPESPFTVLCAGRMQPLKGPQILVAALGRLREKHPECRVRLILAGRGSADFLAELRILADEFGVADAVEFRDSMPTGELANLMRGVDAVAMPSSSETFGLVALEAQACGTPVLATDVDGLRYAVLNGETGWLVPGRTPELWADALYRAAANPAQWHVMSRAAARRARALTWDHVARQHAAAYRQCAGCGGAA